MNIFVISRDPKVCARALDDLRLNKMILETGQLLCNAIRHHMHLYLNNDQIEQIKPILYKATHTNHPCSLWASKKIVNFLWLVKYFIELNIERSNRFEKGHLTYEKLMPVINLFPVNVSLAELENVDFDFDCSNVYGSNMTNLPADEFLFLKYRVCLVDKWRKDKREPKWTFRDAPSFYKEPETVNLVRVA